MAMYSKEQQSWDTHSALNVVLSPPGGVREGESHAAEWGGKAAGLAHPTASPFPCAVNTCEAGRDVDLLLI